MSIKTKVAAALGVVFTGAYSPVSKEYGWRVDEDRIMTFKDQPQGDDQFLIVCRGQEPDTLINYQAPLNSKKVLDFAAAYSKGEVHVVPQLSELQ